jgi:hypothetical protein
MLKKVTCRLVLDAYEQNFFQMEATFTTAMTPVPLTQANGALV